MSVPSLQKASAGNETKGYYSLGRWTGPVLIRRLACRLGPSGPSTADGVSRHSRPCSDQLSPTAAPDTRVANRPRTGRRSDNLSRTDRHSSRFASDGLSLRAGSRSFRADENNAPREKLERLGCRDSRGHRHILVYVSDLWTLWLSRGRSSALRRDGYARAVGGCAALYIPADPTHSSQAPSSSTDRGARDSY